MIRATSLSLTDGLKLMLPLRFLDYCDALLYYHYLLPDLLTCTYGIPDLRCPYLPWQPNQHLVLGCM